MNNKEAIKRKPKKDNLPTKIIKAVTAPKKKIRKRRLEAVQKLLRGTLDFIICHGQVFTNCHGRSEYVGTTKESYLKSLLAKRRTEDISPRKKLPKKTASTHTTTTTYVCHGGGCHGRETGCHGISRSGGASHCGSYGCGGRFGVGGHC